MPHWGLYLREGRKYPVVEMTYSGSASRLGSEFDDFLFAPIGEDRNGMLLSVLSALARLDIDPWQEALASAVVVETYGPPRLQEVFGHEADQSAPTYPVSGRNPGQDGDPHVLVLIIRAATKRHFHHQVSRTPIDC
jgi:hypothetical protein